MPCANRSANIPYKIPANAHVVGRTWCSCY